VNFPKANVTIARSAKTQTNEIAVIINVENLPKVQSGDTAEVLLGVTKAI